MRIGFDAKRIFYNKSGLGNYGRNTIHILLKYFPDHEYYLYTPSTQKALWSSTAKNIRTITPNRYIDTLIPSYWRTMTMSRQIAHHSCDIFHGMNGELPRNINSFNIKTVMTVHDLIFLRFPQYYKPIDRIIYTIKSKHGVKTADIIIANSYQTKNDFIHYLHADPEKIHVIHLNCNPIFYTSVNSSYKAKILKKYKLPEQFILSVGTIEERKNLLSVIKAIHSGSITIPLVIIGRSTPYLKQLQHYIDKHNLAKQFHLRHNVETNDLPALYQSAELLILLSLFEGFGFPILEALYSKIPVIASKGGCFHEVGGRDSLYVDPQDIDEIQDSIKRVLEDSQLRTLMTQNGYRHAQLFNEDVVAKKVMTLYQKVLNQ